MSLPASDNFTGTTGDPINGRTTTTGGLTWTANASWQINANRAYTNGANTAALVNSGVTDHIVSIKPVGSLDFNIVVFRSNSGATTRLEAWVQATQIRIFDESSAQIGSTYTGTVSAGDIISVECNGTSIVVKQNGTTRITTTSSHGSSGTYVGMRGSGDELFDDFSVDAFAVASPTATLTKANTTTVYLAGTAGSGGTSPQWSRSLATDSGFSNLSNGSGISGATTDNLTDASAGIAAGTRYFYKVTYATSGASNVQSGGRWRRPAYVLFIGDSVTQGFGTSAPSTGGTNVGTTSPIYHFSQAVKRAANGQRDVIVYDASESGTKASDWYDAAGSGAQTRLVNAKTNGLAAGCLYSMVTLGINDAYSAETTAQFQANISGLANYLISNGYTGVILNYPTGIPEDGTGALAKLLTLTANLDALVNGTTILRGDTLMLAYMQDHRAAELQTSGTAVHPNDTGARSVGEAWAWAWANLMDPPGRRAGYHLGI